jgi:hypothetical protein
VTIYDFLELNEDEQANAIYAYGVLVSSRDTEDCKVLLYQIESFYVEIHFNPLLSDISRICCFKNLDRLNPYLEKIDVYRLLEI